MFDLTYPFIDEDVFEFQDWRHVYFNVSERMTPNALKDLGKFLISRHNVIVIMQEISLHVGPGLGLS